MMKYVLVLFQTFCNTCNPHNNRNFDKAEFCLFVFYLSKSVILSFLYSKYFTQLILHTPYTANIQSHKSTMTDSEMFACPLLNYVQHI